MSSQVVAKAGELASGEHKQVVIGGAHVLVVRLGDEYHAVGGACTHNGALLAKGVVSDDCVVCPLHHARYRVTTGEQVDPPGYGPLPRYDVEVRGEDVVVHLPPGDSPPPSSPAPPARSSTDQTLVIVGAGPAGLHAAEAAREEGFSGRVVMITREAHLPYDRSTLSKEYLLDEMLEDSMRLRKPAWYEENGIEVITGKEVVRFDADEKLVAFGDGSTMRYDAAVLATGAEARPLAIPGAELPGVFTLRSYDDAVRLRDAAQAARRAVVIGSGFIGLEVASSLRSFKSEVTVVTPEAEPLERLLGADVGGALRRWHESKGVSFRMGRMATRVGGDGAASSVVLDGGEELAADLVVAGLGAVPATSYLRGVPLSPDGGVMVDQTLKVREGLYAAGDLARFPAQTWGSLARVEHWRVACQMGRVAGRNAAGASEVFAAVPFFWTTQHRRTLRYVGYAAEWDRVTYDGSLDDYSFIAYYVKDDEVVAAAAIRRDQELAAIEELMMNGVMPAPKELEGGSVNLIERLRSKAAAGNSPAQTIAA